MYNMYMSDQDTPMVTYQDDDLVYVDPDARIVVGIVEWGKNGNPTPKAMPDQQEEEKSKKGIRKRKFGPTYYPWGTYKSMKSIYRLEGKQKKDVPTATLDQVIEKALQHPFWD